MIRPTSSILRWWWFIHSLCLNKIRVQCRLPQKTRVACVGLLIITDEQWCADSQVTQTILHEHSYIAGECVCSLLLLLHKHTRNSSGDEIAKRDLMIYQYAAICQIRLFDHPLPIYLAIFEESHSHTPVREICSEGWSPTTIFVIFGWWVAGWPG